MTLWKCTVTSGLWEWCTVALIAQYNLRSSSSAHSGSNRRTDSYLDDAVCEMSICVSRFWDSSFSIHFKMHPFSHSSGRVLHYEQTPQVWCRTCHKQWNRWLKRQLAIWTIADLFNSVVTWSKDDHQLVLPNYSDVPQHEEHVSKSEKYQTRAHAGRSEGRRVKGGTGVLTGIYPLPRGTLSSVGSEAMLKPSVGPLSRGHVKQDVCCGLTFHGPNYNIIIRRELWLHSSLRWDSVSIWDGDEWKPCVAICCPVIQMW